MGKYHDRINWKKELRLLPGYIIVCAWIALTAAILLWVRRAHPSPSGNTFLNKGNSDGQSYGLFQWPEVG